MTSKSPDNGEIASTLRLLRVDRIHLSSPALSAQRPGTSPRHKNAFLLKRTANISKNKHISYISNFGLNKFNARSYDRT
jgi:hypothetical protein